ncbi:MAG: hypothetical protein NTW86_14575 [Candidatus Sumerlaeota bacterium]|nr:hypothetical protein [Candidatus Sumerlaeota bacterium]
MLNPVIREAMNMKTWQSISYPKLTASLFPLLCSVALPVRAHAEIVPAGLFSDNALFQQGVALPVWGAATADERAVSVSYKGQSVTGPVENGKWRVFLKPLSADSQPADMTIRGAKSSLLIKNTLVGEVWLASGQSNMEFGLNSFAKSLPDIGADIESANYPALRFVKIDTQAYPGERPRDNTGWRECSSSTAGGFSATAFYFARELHKQTGVPVGIIVCAWSGSAIDAWIPEESLIADPDLKGIIEQYRKEAARYTAEEYEKAVKEVDEQNRLYDQKLKQGADRKDIGSRPQYPMGPKCRTRPCGHYDVMLKPLAPYAIRGFIWYQGEGNASSSDFERSGPYLYRKMLAAMIAGWRKDWNDAGLPFLYVQLPSWKGKPLEGYDEYQNWAELRDSQIHVLRSVPHTGMAVTVDVGDRDNIHPPRKEPVGRRLALCAQRIAYGSAVNFSAGPVYRSCRTEKNRIVVSFDYADSGLTILPPASEFSICGPDQKFLPARAQIEGDAVAVWSEDIENPVAVRYGWKNFFEPELFDQNGLPASPFRTDAFPLVSQRLRKQ